MKITKEQYNELCESHFYDTREEFHKLLEEITGIEAQEYTGYQYYCLGNYVGDTDNSSVKDLLDNSYIEVEGL